MWGSSLLSLRMRSSLFCSIAKTRGPHYSIVNTKSAEALFSPKFFPKVPFRRSESPRTMWTSYDSRRFDEILRRNWDSGKFCRGTSVNCKFFIVLVQNGMKLDFHFCLILWIVVMVLMWGVHCWLFLEISIFVSVFQFLHQFFQFFQSFQFLLFFFFFLLHCFFPCFRNIEKYFV